MDKKENEKRILNLIYSEGEYIEINVNECPDFIITNKKCDFLFGVEVTELFADETEARLINIPNYISEITKNNKFKSKKDIQKLEVVTLTSIPNAPDEKVTKFKGIIRKSEYTFEMFLSNLLQAIEKKDNKHLKYRKDISVIDLIIYNHNLSFNQNNEDLFYKMISSEKFRTCIINSRFREIFFVSVFNKSDEQYIGLKSKLFAMMYFWFLDISTRFYGREFLDVNKILNHDRLLMFGVFLLKCGFQNVYISAKGVPKLLYSVATLAIDHRNSQLIKENRTSRIVDAELLHVDLKLTHPISDAYMDYAKNQKNKKVPVLNEPLLFDANITP